MKRGSMKKLLILLLASLACSLPAFAQNADEPASKDDILLLLRTMNSHDMMERTMQAIIKPMQQMTHEQFAKDKDKLPPDFESRMNKVQEEMFKNMPFDEMMQAMIPAYQKHFTHGDIEAMNAFYASPVGQKFLHESPEVTAEAMQEMVPIMTKWADQWQQRMQKEIKEMEDGSPKKAGTASTPQS
jgi:uncharacterized protein